MFADLCKLNVDIDSGKGKWPIIPFWKIPRDGAPSWNQGENVDQNFGGKAMYGTGCVPNPLNSGKSREHEFLQLVRSNL